MASYELVEGEQGDVYLTSIYDKNSLDPFNMPQLISFAGKGIVSATMFISATTNFENNPLKTVALTLFSDNQTAWNINAGDYPPAGDYYVQLAFYGAGNILIRKTYDVMTMKVKPKLGSP